MEEQTMTRREKRRRRQIRRRIRFAVTVLVMLTVLTAVAVVCFRYVFVSSDITVINETPYDTSELMEWTGYDVGDSLFGLDTSSFSVVLKEFPYVKDVQVSRKAFANPVFSFTYAEPYFVLQTGEAYLVLDRDYKILEILDSPSESLPLIVGIEVGTRERGTVLTEEDNLELSVLTDLAALLEKADWMNETDKIDFSRVYNISFTVHGNLTVELGTSTDLERKIDAARYVADLNDPDRKAKISVRNYASPRYLLMD